MGAAESKNQIPTPETPQYLKYSHLKEIEDPRSPGGFSRTPILTVDDKAKLIDPRSPTSVVPRTPIFCIPEPKDEVESSESVSEVIVIQDAKREEMKEKKNTAEIEGLDSSVSASPEHESSPEKSPNKVEFSDKGYLVTKSKSKAGNKKRRRRRKMKAKNDENSVPSFMIKKNFKGGDENEKVKRSPLASRNFRQLVESESPSMDMLIKNTKKLSVNAHPKSLKFDALGNNFEIGKENLAATFSP